MSEMKNTLRWVVSLLLPVLCVSTLLTVPAWADDEALRQELEALKKRVETLEQELARSKQAAAAAPAKDAEALRARNGSRVQISGYTEIRATNVGNPAGDRVKGADLDFQVAR